MPDGSSSGATERYVVPPRPQVGPWLLDRELGRGASGVVFQARHAETGQAAALKLLPPDLDSTELARLEREAGALQQVAHPGLVRLLGIGRAERGVWMALELVEGPTLHQRVRQSGPLSPAAAARAVEALAVACEHMHRVGVVHRDIKPANVLLPPLGAPRLIDFGLVRAQVPGQASLTATGTLLGTPGFMAPEQIEARPVDARSDVYGLGGTLYFALTGQSPYEGQDALKVIRAQLNEPPPAPGSLRAGIPTELERVCLRCLERDPARRWPSALALAQALRACAAGREAPAPARAWGAGPLAAGVLVLGGAVAAGVLLLGPARRPSPQPPVSPVSPAPPPPAVPDPAIPDPATPDPASPDPATPDPALPDPITPDPRPVGPPDVPDPAPSPPEPASLPLSKGAALRARAQAAAEAGDTEQALALYEQAIAADPRDALSLTRRGSIRMGKGDFVGARADLDRALEIDPAQSGAWAQRAVVRMLSRDMAGAEADCTRALELDPRSGGSWLNRANCRLARNDRPGALSDYDRALELMPQQLVAWMGRAEVRQSVGDLQGALEDYGRALALRPGDLRLLQTRASLRAQTGDMAGAVEDLSAALAQQPRNPGALANRGAARLALGDGDGALADLDLALEIDPQEPLGLLNRGGARLTLGDPQGAVQDLERLLGQLPAGDWRRAQTEALLRQARAALQRRGE